ncbi:hypothetical protein Q3G72_027005 [Acer saccharum]|nr:hypothetical protein Q3G72_027005 [Acer saccharum]
MLWPTASAQASHQRCNSSNNHDDNKSSSHFQSTLCLYNWWLIKSDEIFEGKRLAVAGYTSRELKARRVFTSAPIVKQYDIFTVESADGICIILKGLMNKLRAKENGFSAEDFSHFLYGFPPSWEAYNEKCLKEEFTTRPSLATTPNTKGLATGHDGMKNTNPNTTPINYEVNGKNKHNVEDINEGSENVSEKVTTNASKGSDWQNHAAEDNNIEKAKDHASENLRPSMSCDINVVSLLKDNLALPAESSSYNVTESPERMANSKSCDEEPAVPMGDSGLDLRITSRKSKTQEPACLESISIGNAASGECSISKASDSEYLKSSNLDPAVPVGNPGVDLRITSSRPKNSEHQDENGETCGNKDCSTFSLPQEFVATVRCTGEKPSGVEGSSLSGFGLGMMHTPSLSTSPIYKDPNYRKPSGNCADDTMNFPTVTPTKVHTNTLNVTPSNSGSRKTRSQNKCPGFTGSVKCKNKELMPKTSKCSDGENLKSCSSGTAIHSGKKIDILEAALSQSWQSICKMVSVGSATLVSDGTSNFDIPMEGINKFDFCDDQCELEAAVEEWKINFAIPVSY